MIVNRQRRVRVPLRELEEFLGRVRREFGMPQGQEFTVCLVSDAEMARLNHRFRGKQAPTDVLSFPMSGKQGRDQQRYRRERKETNKTNSLASFTSLTSATAFSTYLGDIAISAETARRNARRLGRGLPAELGILVVHGVLHLLGYDHESDGGQMNRLERRLRWRLGLARRGGLAPVPHRSAPGPVNVGAVRRFASVRKSRQKSGPG